MARSNLDALLESGFRIRPGEARRVGLMFLYLMGVVSTFIVGRTVRDTLFLSRYPLSRLPLMYVAVAASVSAASYLYSRSADRLRRDRTIERTLALSAGSVVLVWGLLATDRNGDWLYPALYVLVEIIGALSIIQFWTFANDLYSAREAKRLFGVIGAGGVLSNIFCGLAIGAVVPVIGAENLLLVCAALLGACIFAVRALGRLARGELEQSVVRPKKARIGLAADSGRVLGSRHLKLIAGIVSVTFLSVSIIDYQFKVIAKATYGEAELAAFFGYFYACTGIVSSLIQFFGTSRLLERRGIVVSLAVLPVGLLLGVVAMLVPGVSTLAAATLAKAAENVFRYTINDASTQLLYVPVPANYRGRAKAFIDGILKPVSIGVAGLVLMGLGRVLPKERFAVDLAYVDLVMLAGWVAMVVTIRREYVRSLIDTLHARKLDFSTTWHAIKDESTVRTIKRSLESTQPEQVMNALELVPVTDASFEAELAGLFRHPSRAVQTRALKLYGTLARGGDPTPIRPLLETDDDELRASAIGAYCAIGREGAVLDVVPQLSHPSPSVRGAAVGALIKHGGLDGVLTAAEALKSLLTGAEAAARIQGARVLGEIKVRNFHRPVLDLLRDPEPTVRLAAVEAAGAMQSPELVAPLVAALADPKTSAASARALAAYGASVERALFAALAAPEQPLAVRRKLPKVIGLVGGQRAATELVAGLGAEDVELRTALAKATSRIRERIPGVAIDDRALDAAIRRELRDAYQLLAIVEDLGLERSSLLPEALWVQHRTRLGLAFRLFEIRYPAKTIQTVYSNLDAESKALRANALEVVDNLLAKEEARLLLPLLDDHDVASKVRAGSELFELERQDAEGWLARLVEDRHPWISACALDLVRRRGLLHLHAAVERHLDSPDAVVRETACLVLATFVRANATAHTPNDALQARNLLAQARRAAEDGAPEVRRASVTLLGALTPG